VVGKLIGAFCGVAIAKQLVLPLTTDRLDSAAVRFLQSDDDRRGSKGTVRLFNPKLSILAFEDFDTHAQHVLGKLAALPQAESRRILARMEGVIAESEAQGH